MQIQGSRDTPDTATISVSHPGNVVCVSKEIKQGWANNACTFRGKGEDA